MQQRELGNALREAREAKNLRGVDVAEFLDVDPSTITKWEKAERRPQSRDLIALSNLYGWSRERTDELRVLAKTAETSGFWQSPNLEDKTRNYLSLEASASSIKNFELTVIPGLLQARDYAYAVVSSVRPGFSDGELNATVDSRMKRRQVLRDPQRASLHTIVDEGVLYRAFGGRRAMHDQLRDLLSFAAYPNITIQILPFSVAASQAQDGSFTLLDFPKVPSYAYSEGQLGQIFQDEESEVSRCRDAFSNIASLAESPEQTVERIKRRLAETNES
ncbi:helix-turn-helix domain-containing protein [Actinoplanes sp. NPDC049599]|jgi:transcriptional regulator with XRE-family HTH domain|uniref:helix-turn-helix domain-containing protein n=1 Tax=Actinoplanes sp. NPDC049599 TaxID=3363903 RepID=UPI0037BCBFF7